LENNSREYETIGGAHRTLGVTCRDKISNEEVRQNGNNGSNPQEDKDTVDGTQKGQQMNTM